MSTVGRAVASNTRGPEFESSHRHPLLDVNLPLTVCRKDKNKEKEAKNGRPLKNVKKNREHSLIGECTEKAMS